MKTKEQIKSEVLNYLTKTTGHLFTIGKSEHKILLEGDFYIIITGDSVSINNVDTMIGYYSSNTKCVIKHQLFLIPRYYNKEIKSIPNYKLAKEKYSLISESIKGKTDKNEIQKIIKDILDIKK
jgi:hypothetical protein